MKLKAKFFVFSFFFYCMSQVRAEITIEAATGTDRKNITLLDGPEASFFNFWEENSWTG